MEDKETGMILPHFTRYNVCSEDIDVKLVLHVLGEEYKHGIIESALSDEG